MKCYRSRSNTQAGGTMSLAAFPVAVPEEDNGTMNRRLKNETQISSKRSIMANGMLNDDVSKHLSPTVRTAGSLASQLHCKGLDRCSPGPRRRKIAAQYFLFWSSCGHGGVERYDLSEIFPQTGSLARQHRRCGLDRRSPDLRR